jgi:alpha-glucuronidase
MRSLGASAAASPSPEVTARVPPQPVDDDGYRLWLRYDRVSDERRLVDYRALTAEVILDAKSPTLEAARRELSRGLSGLLGRDVRFVDAVTRPGALLVGTPRSSVAVASLGLGAVLARLGPEGFVVRRAVVSGKPITIVAASDDVGVLYGVFAFLRHLQTGRGPDGITTESAPQLTHRFLNHWDNLDRTVERGYAGFSIWDWHHLPDCVSPQYEDYARANASIGINGVALTNVNADALVLTAPYVEKVAALAAVFRAYGIRVYLTARFSAPVEIGGLATADPLDPAVARFWRDTCAAIYERVPDFGGFVVKANAEGQPGPSDYGRTHADGANVLADALRPHGGIVMWRAFVYANRPGADRARQAYDEFLPLDGAFRDNVLLQVKNGPIDFQPREPFHPLFGAMRATPLIGEFQITQEYLGFATHLVYLGTLFQETLDSDTFARGPGSSVASVLKGEGRLRGGMCGVANVGTDRNWCGHPFAQANWFAFGRLAWDPAQRADAIADDWIRMTFSNDERLVDRARSMMSGSREAAVDYMTPLGLHHLMARDHHYGPGPWVSPSPKSPRADWSSVYYHRADAAGLGFDRSATGSNAVAQYPQGLAGRLAQLETCPEELLLWFHHVAWDHRLRSGRILWDELCHKYDAGVSFVRAMRATWEAVEPLVDARRHRHVRELLAIQEREARWWRDACVLYFQTFARRPIPRDCAPPTMTLDECMRIRPRHVPGVPRAAGSASEDSAE